MKKLSCILLALLTVVLVSCGKENTEITKVTGDACTFPLDIVEETAECVQTTEAEQTAIVTETTAAFDEAVAYDAKSDLNSYIKLQKIHKQQ